MSTISNDIKFYIPPGYNNIADTNIKLLSIDKIHNLKEDIFDIYNNIDNLDINTKNIYPLTDNIKLDLNLQLDDIDNNYILTSNTHLNNYTSITNKINKLILKSGDSMFNNLFLNGIDSNINGNLIVGHNSSIINIGNHNTINNINIGTTLKSKIINIGTDNSSIKFNGQIISTNYNDLSVNNRNININYSDNSITPIGILFNDGFISINNLLNSFNFKLPNNNIIYNLSHTINVNSIIIKKFIDYDINLLNNNYYLFKNNINNFFITNNIFNDFYSQIDNLYSSSNNSFVNKYDNYLLTFNNNKLLLFNSNYDKLTFYNNL